jgi:hypothetical protein
MSAATASNIAFASLRAIMMMASSECSQTNNVTTYNLHYGEGAAPLAQPACPSASNARADGGPGRDGGGGTLVADLRVVAEVQGSPPAPAHEATTEIESPPPTPEVAISAEEEPLC